MLHDYERESACDRLAPLVFRCCWVRLVLAVLSCLPSSMRVHGDSLGGLLLGACQTGWFRVCCV